MSKNPYVRKTYLSKIWNLIGKDLVKVITGMRRTGKSTIMDQIVSGLVAEGIPESDILKYDMESRRTPRFRDGDELYDDVASWASGKGHTYIFLDEIQECPNARTALKSFATDKRYRVIASGSADWSCLKQYDPLMKEGTEHRQALGYVLGTSLDNLDSVDVSQYKLPVFYPTVGMTDEEVADILATIENGL